MAVLIFFTGNIVIAKILITGASGFVGSHILQTLMAIGHKNLQPVAACREPRRLPPGYTGEVRQGDLRDPAYLDRLLVGIDIVCHTAGWTSFVNKQAESRELYLEPTLELIRHVLEWRVPRFVNLSSIAVTSVAQRNDAEARARPRRYWPMISCMGAVEDFMLAHATQSCSFVNLRCGIYSGHRLHNGLLPLLISRLNSSLLPHNRGKYGYLPLVDGIDLGQAFTRAALAPESAGYVSMNILGPDQPSHAEVIQFIQQHMGFKQNSIGLPRFINQLLHPMLALIPHGSSRLFTRNLSDYLSNPRLSNEFAQQQLGYDPTVSWQASLLNLLNDYKKQPDTSALYSPFKPLDPDR
jgi:nucleoside-diphosphate-sugar epimerase